MFYVLCCFYFLPFPHIWLKSSPTGACVCVHIIPVSPTCMASHPPLPINLYIFCPYILLLQYIFYTTPLAVCPGNGDCTMLGEDGAEAPPTAQSLPNSECQRAESKHGATTPLRTCDPALSPRKSRRTRVAKANASCPASLSNLSSPLCPVPLLPVGSVGVNALSSPAHCPLGSAPVSPSSRSDCSSGGSGLERGSMDESWFVTPPPCFTAEGATAETSPMEDLLIEHPSMSVYVSPSNLSMVEQSAASLASSVR